MQNTSSRESDPVAAAILWASAFLIGAMILLQVGRSGVEPAAHAEMVATGSEYNLLTTASQTEDLIYVLERRTGRMLIYGPTQNQGLQLLDVVDVSELVTRLSRPTNSGP